MITRKIGELKFYGFIIAAIMSFALTWAIYRSTGVGKKATEKKDNEQLKKDSMKIAEQSFIWEGC